MNTVFLRLVDVDDKATGIRFAIREPDSNSCRRRYTVKASAFSAVPRSPFAYWLSESVRDLFRTVSLWESEGQTAKIGLSTSDDFRFIRTWWAVSSAQVRTKWLPFAKGGRFSAFHADIHLVLNWTAEGKEMKAWVVSNPTDPRTSHWSRRIANSEYFFRPGLTWPLRTQLGLSFRAMPAGCLFGHKGPAAFVKGDSPEDLLAVLAIVNSKSFSALVNTQMAFGSYEVGVIQRTPVPDVGSQQRAVLAEYARRGWSLKFALDSCCETSHAFTVPALLQTEGSMLADCADAWTSHATRVKETLAALQQEIDTFCFELYGIRGDDRQSIVDGFADSIATHDESLEDEADADGEQIQNDTAERDVRTLVVELVSWAVGVSFGRFDVRLATGTRQSVRAPEPFEALPVSSPGMLTDEDNLHLNAPPAEYPIAFPQNGILVDDPGSPADLNTAIRTVFSEVFGTASEDWLNNSAKYLDQKSQDLRPWLSTELFEHHLRTYSKSRRKAPIYWQLGVPSGRYSIWLYAHRLTRDSFFQIQNDVVIPKLLHEERQLDRLLKAAGSAPSAQARREINAQESLIEELRILLEEVKRVAPFWHPTLDDGVVLTMAPLWRLVPQHRSWQRELKNRWDELVAGKYDWSHIAMHLWPERVVPKCRSDRSLAIAHGLEDVFWSEDADDKWKPRPTPSRSENELIQERSSAAVKSALKSLLESPGTRPSSRRRRGDTEGAALA